MSFQQLSKGLKSRFESARQQVRQWPLFSRRNDTSIATSVLLMHTLWGLVVYFFALLCLWWVVNSVISVNLQDQARRWVKAADELGVPLYVSQDPQVMDEIARQMESFSSVDYLRYYGPQGKTLVGEYRSIKAIDTPLDSLTSNEVALLSADRGQQLIEVDVERYEERKIIRAMAPVWIRSITSDGMMDFELQGSESERSQLIGFIELGVDYSQYQQQLAERIWQGSLLAAVVFALLLFLGYLHLKRILRPLEELQTPLARLAEGDMRVRVKRSGVREVSAISDALNSTIHAIAERDQALRDLANHDSLTHLVNRHFFTDQVISELLTVEDTQQTSALFFIDLDEFKAINDRLGHDAGDRLLVQVAEILKSRVREYDVVSRFGGDEFVVLVSGVGELEAQQVAEGILQLMEGYQYSEQGQVFNICCSIGITMIESSQFTVDELLKQADSACQMAKLRGRNGLVMYDAGQMQKQQLLEDSGWSKKLAAALKDDRFVLHYQPILDLKSQQVRYYEVLLRMQGEPGELIPPDAFLGAADRFGFSVEVARWVIEHALSTVAHQPNKTAGLSINLSAKALEDTQFIDWLGSLIKETEIEPSRLAFEVEEQALLNSRQEALLGLKALSGLGCVIIMDGFCAGLSASGKLQNIPFDGLKIQRELVTGLLASDVNKTLVSAIAELARVMGKFTIAGFVQDELTLSLVKEMGVDCAQGYFLATPNCFEELDDVFKTHP
ncbi:sensory box/ggdef domain/eal domain protein [gamma proteobacterium HTCC5015]|nr:sensory box/ggdef domain/eal domain protein [gamma proteobacterium HTCC5015]